MFLIEQNDDLDQLEKSLLEKEIKELKGIIEDKNAKIKDLTGKIAAHALEQSEKEEEIRELKNEQNKYAKKAPIREEISNTGASVEEVQNLKAKISNYLVEIDELLKRNRKLKVERDELDIQLKDLRNQSQSFKDIKKSQTKSLEESNFKYEQLNVKNEQLLEKIEQVTSKNINLTEELDRIKKENAEIRFKFEKLDNENREIKSKYEILENNLEQTNKDLTQSTEDNNLHLSTIAELKLELKKLKNQKAPATQENDEVIIELKKDIKVLRRERDHYKEIIKKHKLI